MPGYRNTVVLAVRSGARATQECVCEMCVREIANNQGQRALGLCLEREYIAQQEAALLAGVW